MVSVGSVSKVLPKPKVEVAACLCTVAAAVGLVGRPKSWLLGWWVSSLGSWLPSFYFTLYPASLTARLLFLSHIRPILYNKTIIMETLATYLYGRMCLH